MKKFYKQAVRAFVMLFLLALPYSVFAKSVVFPSLTQAGTALLTETADEWTFSNALFSASFQKTTDGKLFFNGSTEMSLEAGTEIFQIVLGDGTKVKASQMTWGAIEAIDLAGDATAMVFAETLNGKALKATLSYGNLNFIWRAVLRDGSHYLRTELEITSTADTSLQSITPMMYRVINGGNPAPAVVGNTRGAVIASQNIFAATETPLAFNMVSGTYNPNFKVNSWTPASWLAAESVPSAILAMGFSESQVAVSEGDVTVSSGGTWTFKFLYSSGTHRMNLTGVDLVKDGAVVASDYHKGFTGNAAENNTYTLNIPAGGNYRLRYWGETKTETITSSGNITVATTATFNPANWVPADWKPASNIPSEILALGTGFTPAQIAFKEGTANILAAGNVSFTFQYTGGTHRMNLTGVDIMKDGVVVASDYHIGYTGNNKLNNVYTINVPAAGVYTLRYFGETKTETITSSGNITFGGATVTAATPTITAVPYSGVDPITNISGKWSRNTTLRTTDTFKVSAVVGLIATNQARRSFLSYIERERAVPWRSFSLYNSWYELNINRNNDPDPMKRMIESQTLSVVNAWKTQLYDKYNVGVNAFVWDDGWDDFNSLWDFHIGFPQGFTNVDKLAAQQGAGTGAWLGPVGGYGSSKAQRLAYWNSTHDPDISNFQLSNQEYFDAFVGRCSQMVNDYDMRYFKFDGISAQYEAYGPSNEEDAEGILNVITALRNNRPDLFVNTTVGTWASPFWFRYSDCVWRQRDDYGTIGDQGDAREKWITYRDQLVYKNFVQGSPLCPINSLMTHGLMVTKYGPPAAMPRDNTDATKKGIIKEMRCAFASGTNMVELYLDNDLMTTIGGGELWKELAACIHWHRANEDVLADVHWVGGNPWDGTKANVYGWAAWNPSKSTLTLRNPSGTTQTFKISLRQALDIPAYVTGSIKLTDAFMGQTQYSGITGQLLDIDTELTFNMPAFDVVVFNGRPEVGAAVDIPTFVGYGNWSDDTNWLSGVKPLSASDNAIIASPATLDQNATINNLTIKSGATLVPTTGSLTVDGLTTVEQAAKKHRTYYMGAPVGGATSSTGIGAVIEFTENTNQWTTATNPFGTVGKGYAVQVGANQTENESTTISISGTLNNSTDPITIPMTKDKRRFNFFSNPYPSYLDTKKMEEANTGNIEGTLWFCTKDNGYQFVTLNIESGLGSPAMVDRYIAPLQGFWVRTENAGNFIFNNTMRTHKGSSSSVFRAPQASELQILRLTLSNGIKNDETVIVFSESATEKWNSSKMMNPELNIYTLKNGKELAINSSKTIEYDVEIAVGVKAASGTHTFSVIEYTNFGAEKTYLLDKAAKVAIDLSSGDYTVNLTKDYDGTDRFALVFPRSGVITGMEGAESAGFFAFANNNRITVNSDAQSGVIYIFNGLGQQVAAQAVSGNLTTISNVLPAGVYVVKLNNLTTKVVVK